MSMLDKLLLAVRQIWTGGAPVTLPAGVLQPPVLNFASGASALYNPTTGNIDVSLETNSLTPQAYGAIGNNVADDTVAFGKFFSAAQSTGLRGFVPAATYKVETLTIPAGVYIEGAGQGKTIINAANTTGTGASVVMSTGSRLKSLTVTGASKVAVSIPGGVSNVVLADVEMTGATQSVLDGIVAGLAIGDGVNGPVANVLVDGCYIHDNGGTGYGAEVYSYYGYANTNVTIQDSRIVGTVSVFAMLMFNAHQFTIDGNFVDQGNTLNAGAPTASGYGIAMYDAVENVSRNIITNNQVQNCAGSGVYYNGGPYASGLASPLPAVIVSGNQLYNVALQEQDSSLLVAGITSNAPRSIITGNVVDTTGTYGAGISVQGLGIVVQGNTVRNVTTRGAIRVQPSGDQISGHGGSRTIVQGNAVVDCLLYGIELGSSGSYLADVIVEGNTLGWDYQLFTVSSGNTLQTFGSSWANGQMVRVRSVNGTLLSGLSPTTVYYIVNWTTVGTTNTFSLSLTSGGSAVNVGSAGTGTYEVCVSPLSGGTAIYSPGQLNTSRISGNILEGFRAGGIYISGSASADVQICNNIVENCSLDGTPASYYAILNSYGSNSIISGNRCTGGNMGGIYDAGTYSTLVGNNVYSSSTTSAFSIQTTSISVGNIVTEVGDTYIESGTGIVLSSPNVFFNNSRNANAELEITPGTGAGVSIATVGGVALTLQSGAMQLNGTSVGFYGVSPVSQATRAGQLTDNTGGSSGSSCNSVGVAFNEATLNNNFATVIERLNAIDTIIHNLGLST